MLWRGAEECVCGVQLAAAVMGEETRRSGRGRETASPAPVPAASSRRGAAMVETAEVNDSPFSSAFQSGGLTMNGLHCADEQ